MRQTRAPQLLRNDSAPTIAHRHALCWECVAELIDVGIIKDRRRLGQARREPEILPVRSCCVCAAEIPAGTIHRGTWGPRRDAFAWRCEAA
jgi:hypothetical protein